MVSGIWRTQRGRQAGSRGRTFQAGSESRGRSEASLPEASWAKWSFMGKLEAGTAWRLVHGIRFCPTHTGRRAKFQAEALFSKCWLSSKGHSDTEGPGDAAGRKLVGAPTCVDLPVGWGTAASQPAGVWQSQGAAVTLRRRLQDERRVELIGNIREVSPNPFLLSRGCSGCREGPDGMGWVCDHSDTRVVTEGGWSPGCLGLGMCEWRGNLSRVLFPHVSTCLPLNRLGPTLVSFTCCLLGLERSSVPSVPSPSLWSCETQLRCSCRCEGVRLPHLHTALPSVTMVLAAHPCDGAFRVSCLLPSCILCRDVLHDIYFFTFSHAPFPWPSLQRWIHWIGWSWALEFLTHLWPCCVSEAEAQQQREMCCVLHPGLKEELPEWSSENRKTLSL